MRSFSIGGQALEKVKKDHQELGQYNEISKLELHEVTICEKGINPEARFDILKQDKTTNKVKKMSKIEKALAELDALMAEVNTLRKEEDEQMAMPEEEKGMAMMGEEEEEKMNLEEDEKAEYMDDEAKALLSTLDGAGVEIGEPADRVVIVNGKPKASDLPVVKAFDNNDLETLDLSVGNIEKAYGAFRQEQLEKLAYDNLQKSFANRFKNEVSNRENILSKSQYDAQAEIASMKQEFTQLRKSLTAEKETILKAQQESVVTLPSMDELAEMNWSDIHKMVGGV